MLNESYIIDFLKNNFPISGGIGDDAAVLPFSDTQNYVISKDLLVEDVHFRTAYFDAASLAHKSLHVNLSDIAAMGAVPKYVLLGIAVPEKCRLDVEKFLSEFSHACKSSDVQLIGGDTSRSSDKLMISVTAIGLVNKAQLKFRHQAQKNDVICVAGNLGDAHIGLQALEKNISGLEKFKHIFLKPQARLKEGEWLGRQLAVTAMMDISDGLFVDLQKLCEASKLGAELNPSFYRHCEKDTFFVDDAAIQKKLKSGINSFKKAYKFLNLDPLTTQLTGGEDYGLLFTVKSKNYPIIAKAFSKKFGYPLKKIGKMLKDQSSKIIFTRDGKSLQLTLKPFSHFGEL